MGRERAVKVALLAAGAVLCFLAGQLSQGRLVSELREQRGLLQKLSQRIESLDDRSSGTSGDCGRVGPPSATPTSIEEAVARVLDRRDANVESAKAQQAAPTAANIEAFDQGNQLLDDALEQHHWTEQDAVRMKALFRRLTADQREALLQRKTIAFNQGKMKPDFLGPPF